MHNTHHTLETYPGDPARHWTTWAERITARLAFVALATLVALIAAKHLGGL